VNSRSPKPNNKKHNENYDKKMEDYYIIYCWWNIGAAQLNLRRKDFPLLMARDY